MRSKGRGISARDIEFGMWGEKKIVRALGKGAGWSGNRSRTAYDIILDGRVKIEVKTAMIRTDYRGLKRYDFCLNNKYGEGKPDYAICIGTNLKREIQFIQLMKSPKPVYVSVFATKGLTEKVKKGLIRLKGEKLLPLLKKAMQ